MDVDVYTFARDEEAMLPFFLANYSYARKIILYDDDSTDRTLKIARADPKVEIRDANLGYCYDEEAFRQLKNSCWKESDADWVVVCDIDEFLHHPNFWGQLLAYREMGITLPKVQGFEMVAEDGLPSLGRNITDVIVRGVPSQLYSKQAIFNPRKLREINYVHGAHACVPVGDVVVGGDLKLLHYNMLGGDYIVDRWARRRARVSPSAGEQRWKTFDWGEGRLQEYHARLVEDARLVI